MTPIPKSLLREAARWLGWQALRSGWKTGRWLAWMLLPLWLIAVALGAVAEWLKYA